MKRKTRQLLCALTAAALMTGTAAAFTGCKGKDTGTSTNTTAQDTADMAKLAAYKATDVAIPEGVGSITGNVLYSNDTYYAMFFDYKDSTDDAGNYTSNTVAKLLGFDVAGTVKFEYTVADSSAESDGTNSPNYSLVSNVIAFNPDGNIEFRFNTTTYDEDYNETTQTRLIAVDTSGNVVKDEAATPFVTSEEESSGSYFGGMVVSPDGNTYVLINGADVIRAFGPDGKKLYDTEKISVGSNGYINSIFLNNAGKPCISINEWSMENSSAYFLELNTDTHAFGEKHTINAGSSWSIFPGSGDYYCYLRGDAGLSGVRADNFEVEVVLNLMSIGISGTDVSSVNMVDDETIVITNYTYDGAAPINLIKKVDPSELPEKTYISLGCFSLDYSIRGKIAEFNKQSDKYNIVVNSYSDTNNVDDNAAALTKFSNELIAGNIPDIIALDPTMPFDSYVQKGLFTDIYPLMEADGEIKKTDLQTSVLDALDTNGKLYRISPSFNLVSMAGRVSTIGDVKSITMTEAQSYGKDLITATTTRSDFMDIGMFFSDFVDYEAGTCDFDNDAFKQLLTASKDYPETIDYDTLYQDTPNYYEDYQERLRSGDILFMTASLGGYTEYRYLSQAELGDKVAFVNFPTDKPRGRALAYTNSQLAISDKSPNKEGAWQFIKYLLNNTLEKYELSYWDEKGQEHKTGDFRYYNTGFPLLLSQRQVLVDQALAGNYSYNEKGEKEFGQDTYTIGSNEYKYEELTQADIDNVNGAIDDIFGIYQSDENITKIINEEASAFYAGTKTIDETAQIVQSRASMYMSEQY